MEGDICDDVFTISPRFTRFLCVCTAGPTV